MSQNRVETRLVKRTDEGVVKEIASLNIQAFPGEIANENRDTVKPATTGCRETVFHNPWMVMTDDQIVDFASHGVSGFHRGTDGRMVATNIGRPLHAVNMRFMQVKGREWETPTGGSTMFRPFKTGIGENSDDVILPLVGGIWLEGEDITKNPEILEKLGISMVCGKDGAEATHPAFMSGGRSIVLPGQYMLPAFKNNVGGYGFITLDRLQKAMSPDGNTGVVDQLSDRVRDRLGKLHERQKVDMSKDEFVGRYFEQEFMSQALEASEQASYKWGKLEKAVAVQYKGVGTRKYVYHLDKQDKEGVHIQIGDQLLKVSDANEEQRYRSASLGMAQRTEYDYADKSGTFLEIVHEYFDKSPTGGIYSEMKSYKRDQVLWGEGAQMSGITTGFVRFLNRVDIDTAFGKPTRMVCEETVMAERVILDDTHRLASFTERRGDPGKPSDEFQLFIEGNYDGGYSDAHRSDYLEQLSSNVGKNMGICLDVGLTCAKEQNSAENLSLWGRIIDSQSFMDMKNRYQCGSLIGNWIQNVMDTAKNTGLTAEQYFKSQHFKTLAVQMLGEEEGGKAYKLTCNPEAGTSHMHIADRAYFQLSHLWVKKSLREDGVRIDDKFLLDEVERDPKLRESIGFRGGDTVELMTNLRKLLRPDAKAVLMPIIDAAAPDGVRTETLSPEAFLAKVEHQFISHAIHIEAPSLDDGLDQEYRKERPEIPEVEGARAVDGGTSPLTKRARVARSSVLNGGDSLSQLLGGAAADVGGSEDDFWGPGVGSGGSGKLVQRERTSDRYDRIEEKRERAKEVADRLAEIKKKKIKERKAKEKKKRKADKKRNK